MQLGYNSSIKYAKYGSFMSNQFSNNTYNNTSLYQDSKTAGLVIGSFVLGTLGLFVIGTSVGFCYISYRDYCYVERVRLPHHHPRLIVTQFQPTQLPATTARSEAEPEPEPETALQTQSSFRGLQV